MLEVDDEGGRMFLRVLLHLTMHDYPPLVSGALQLLFKHFSQRQEAMHTFKQVGGARGTQLGRDGGPHLSAPWWGWGGSKGAFGTSWPGSLLTLWMTQWSALHGRRSSFRARSGSQVSSQWRHVSLT